MLKNNRFDEWNELKKRIDLGGRPPYFHPGEIWWAHLGQNIATEINGKGLGFFRPMLILKVVYGNAALAVPLTATRRIGSYYFSFSDHSGIKQCALLAQIRYIDSKRLKSRISRISASDFNCLLDALVDFLQK